MGFGFGNINQNMNAKRRRERELPAEHDEVRGMRRIQDGTDFPIRVVSGEDTEEMEKEAGLFGPKPTPKRVEDYIDANGQVVRDRLAMDTRFGKVSRKNMEEVINDPRVKEQWKGTAYTKKVPKKQWTQQYADKISTAVVGENFNADYMRYLDDVSTHARKMEKLKKVGKLGVGAAALGGAAYGAKKLYDHRKEAHALLDELVMEKQAKETSALRDFAGGLDPTGVTTFNNAMQNDKNHARHKAVGNIGGFVGGAALGAAVPAAIGFGASKALKGRNSMLSTEFGNMAKGSLDVLNPAALKRHIQAIPHLSKYKRQGSDILKKTKQLTTESEALNKAVKLKGFGAAARENAAQAGRVQSLGKEVLEQQKNFDTLQDMISKKYYKGAPVADGAARTMTALGGIGTAAMGGTLNAVSANAQYDTAQRMKDRGKTASTLLSEMVIEKLGSGVSV